ncbi:hypothetical protein Murru_0298 [Allomuricauda ruestringensis DSM 13258]|uniref:DUF2752 domain-containing protein n=1 Tax=Allomuricauda ruestringensis (strain DSM 13258 / CIP 107369 / LMG 19739 / B1) TaxID=886377 RepID=G2PS97_ALLRU|nr:DUF2752 domain-containing protein [Allomuricauda ruestringensis]AEM69354.1 hypothetical protein Murru_0298 [Allomuricauda ruestringensis DSM 13258]
MVKNDVKIKPEYKNNSIFRALQPMMNLTPTINAFSLENYMLPCLNKKILGVDCPGCGLQRSVDLLLHGEFVAAFQMYPAIYTIIPLFAMVISNKVFNLKVDNRLITGLGAATVALILINYIIKFIH